MTTTLTPSAIYMACVPHVPLVSMQQREVNGEFWQAYDARIAELRAFDPELVIVFGGDHYDGMHLKLMPAFAVGLVAEGLGDCGGYPGPLNVPMRLAQDCCRSLVEEGFDIATSYAMEVDHGFTNVLHHFLGALDARPVLPIHINSLCDPKPTFKRCRELGEAIGRFVAGLGQRVAILGSGGLSHQTDFIFPQYDTAPNETIRDFIVHGGARGALTRDRWLQDIHEAMIGANELLLVDKFEGLLINPAWDRGFLRQFCAADGLRAFDEWRCEDVTQKAGYGGGEIRQWIAAGAAARAAGVQCFQLDYYSDTTKLAVGAGVVHGSSTF
jgi:2,3-dihydroxyphenylpropionate 1,2-dioxygenase